MLHIKDKVILEHINERGEAWFAEEPLYSAEGFTSFATSALRPLKGHGGGYVGEKNVV